LRNKHFKESWNCILYHNFSLKLKTDFNCFLKVYGVVLKLFSIQLAYYDKIIQYKKISNIGFEYSINDWINYITYIISSLNELLLNNYCFSNTMYLYEMFD
jgi:hypothetical protein